MFHLVFEGVEIYMTNYAIQILKEERNLLKSNVEWINNPASIRQYKDEDEDNIKRWKQQITELEDAISVLQ